MDIGARLGGQAALGRDEARDPGLAAVVGGSGEADVAVVAGELGQVARRGGERLGRVERIVEAAQPGGLGHELRDALGAGRADRPGLEQAFAPEQAREEVLVERIRPGHRLDGPADVGNVVRQPDAVGAILGAALLRRSRIGPGRRAARGEVTDGSAAGGTALAAGAGPASTARQITNVRKRRAWLTMGGKVPAFGRSLYLGPGWILRFA